VKPVCSIFLVLVILTCCRKDEEIMSGDIRGIAYTHNQDRSTCDDRSGVEVSLFQDSTLFENTLTDVQGKYIFGDIPYGKYRISLRKEGFVQTRSSHILYHVGGYSPTSANYHLHEIPTFELIIDSMRFDNKNLALVLFLAVKGDTLPLSEYIYYHSFRAFFGNSPDVTNHNYVCQGKGYLYEVIAENPSELIVISQISTYEINNNFDQLKSGTIYICIYPLAQGQGYWIEDYYPEALGKPSNVFSFDWDELIGR
jgi:hypothetical protein